MQVMKTEDIERYARLSHINFRPSVTGPFLKLEALVPGYAGFEPVVIGYLTAFIRPIPLGMLHLETIQVANRRQMLGFARKGWTIDGPGISFLMGSWALTWAYNNGCRRAQLLAVKDSESMHNILVRLYERLETGTQFL